MKKSRSANSARNMAVAGISKFLVVLMGFFARTIFIKSLSTEYLGINGLFANILTILSFAELGIGDAMIFSMYMPLKNNDTAKIKSLIKLYKKAYHYIAIFVGLIGVILIPFLKYLIKDPPNIKEDLIMIYLFYLLNTVISYLFIYKKSIITADQNDYIVTAYHNTFYIIQLIIQSVILLITHNFFAYLFIQLLVTFIDNIFISNKANKMYPFIVEKHANSLLEDEKKEIFKNVKALSISKIAGVILNGSDNLIISRMFGITIVGLVSNYTLIINAVHGILWQILSALIASIGNLNTESDAIRKAYVFNQLFLLTYWLYSFSCIAIGVIINPFTEIWIGKNYLLNNLTVFALVWSIYTSGINFPLYSFRMTTGIFNEVKYYYVLSAVANIVLSIILGRKMGLPGVFIGTSLSRLVTTEIADGIYVYKKAFFLQPKKYFIKYYSYLFLFISNYAISYSLSNIVKTNGVFGLIIKLLMCVIVSNLFLYFVFRRSLEFRELKLKAFNIFKAFNQSLKK